MTLPLHGLTHTRLSEARDLWNEIAELSVDHQQASVPQSLTRTVKERIPEKIDLSPPRATRVSSPTPSENSTMTRAVPAKALVQGQGAATAAGENLLPQVGLSPHEGHPKLENLSTEQLGREAQGTETNEEALSLDMDDPLHCGADSRIGCV
jgi:hypothetical protein